MFQDILQPSNVALAEFSVAIILINLAISFVLSLIILVGYRKTHRGLSYSQSFVRSLVMMSVLSSMAMMILGNNLIRALGILGVFTLLRFRTIIKDTLDATYLFFALAVGMAVGTNNYVIAVIGTFFLSGMMLFLHRFNIGSAVQEGYLLTFIASEGMPSEKYESLFKKHHIDARFLQMRGSTKGDTEYYFALKTKQANTLALFSKELQALPEISLVDVNTSRDAAEY